MYSHKGKGVGTLARTGNIAREVLVRVPNASILVTSDYQAKSVVPPVSGIDYLNVPTIVETVRSSCQAPNRQNVDVAPRNSGRGKLVIHTHPAPFQGTCTRRGARGPHARPRSRRVQASVVTMAEDNCVCEVLDARTKALVIQRSGPSAEQKIRTELFRKRGLVRTLSPDALPPESMADRLLHLFEGNGLPDPKQVSPLDGTKCAADVIRNVRVELAKYAESVAFKKQLPFAALLQGGR